jgi:hypothetical protein
MIYDELNDCAEQRCLCNLTMSFIVFVVLRYAASLIPLSLVILSNLFFVMLCPTSKDPEIICFPEISQPHHKVVTGFDMFPYQWAISMSSHRKV